MSDTMFDAMFGAAVAGGQGGDSYTKAETDALLNGKQNTIDSTHMLSSDLVDDTNATHKFATAAQLSQIATNETNISTLSEQVGYAITTLEGVL